MSNIIWSISDQGTDDPSSRFYAQEHIDSDSARAGTFSTMMEAVKFIELCSLSPYAPTHWSILDGSDAMQVDVPYGIFLLTNEDGDTWEDDPADWRTADELESCKHCQRTVMRDGDRWVNPYALDDDSIWRETCDENISWPCGHEPA